MQAKRIVPGLFLIVLIGMMIFSSVTAEAGSITLKVSHHFSAGDVRDQMAP
jgi:hypothetical protein